MLVRGTDRFRRVDIDRPAEVELGDAELAAWRKATRQTGKNVFDGSPLEPSAIYGGV